MKVIELERVMLGSIPTPFMRPSKDLGINSYVEICSATGGLGDACAVEARVTKNGIRVEFSFDGSIHNDSRNPVIPFAEVNSNSLLRDRIRVVHGLHLPVFI